MTSLMSLSCQAAEHVQTIICHLQAQADASPWVCGNAFCNTGGQNEWKLMWRGALEWVCRRGTLILSFYTIHLQSTWLSAFSSTGNLWPPCWICWKPVCCNCSTLPGLPVSKRGRPLNAACLPITVLTDSCQPTAGCQEELNDSRFEKASNCGLSASN